MTTKALKPKVPAGLGKAGGALWRALIDDLAAIAAADGATFEYDRRELSVLREACATKDAIAALEEILANEGGVIPGSKGQLRLSPVFAELRQQRLALQRLLDSLGVPDASSSSATSERKRRAANARWSRDRGRKDRAGLMVLGGSA
jgi:hypothetical protein